MTPESTSLKIAKEAEKVHDTLAFTDENGNSHTLERLGQGEYTTCYRICDNPDWVFKCFRQRRINATARTSKLEWFRDNKNSQYKQLQRCRIPVAETIAMGGGWMQERIPYMVENIKNWDLRDSLHKEILTQIRDILEKALVARIEIDPMPRNFGYSVDEFGHPTVKLFDFREELDEDDEAASSNPLAPYIDKCLDVFSKGNREISAFLDPRPARGAF